MVKIDSKENLIRLVNQYKNLIFSICLKMTGDYFISEDITQETFIAAFRHYDDFDGKNEKAWISRIAGNKCIDYLRSAEHKNIVTAEEEMPEKHTDDLNPLTLYEQKAVMEMVGAACLQLPDTYKEVGTMHFVEGLNAKEIAERTGINIKTVQTQLRRSRECIKKYIRREDLLL